jgi:hypothetical protein
VTFPRDEIWIDMMQFGTRAADRLCEGSALFRACPPDQSWTSAQPAITVTRRAGRYRVVAAGRVGLGSGRRLGVRKLGDHGGLGQQGVELVEEFGAGGVVEALEFSMCVLDAAG